MKRAFRASGIAAATGALLALVLAGMSVGLMSLDKTVPVARGLAEFFAVLFVLFCPPWEMFWSGLGDPGNTARWAALSVAVLAANALLYVPMGLAHAAGARWSTWTRRGVVLLAGAGSLALGHLFFMG